jgi:LysR family glycine cleavage system transcriptional activator
MNSLRMFDAAARHLNFRQAAEELNLTQGAVAQQVRKLESDLGVQLFHRKPRGLALTIIGQRYHLPIQKAFAIIDDATRKILPDRTKLVLSVTPSFAAKWLVPRLASFSQLHPGIEVQTVAHEEIANFQSDGVDLAIRFGSPPFGKGLHSELLAPLKLHAVCSPGYAEQIDPGTQLIGFTSKTLIQDGHNFWNRLFEEAGIENHPRIMQFNQTALAMDAAANGHGIALAPKLLLELELEQGRLVSVWQDAESVRGGYYLVHPTEPKSYPARDSFISWASSEIRLLV